MTLRYNVADPPVKQDTDEPATTDHHVIFMMTDFEPRDSRSFL